LKTNHLATQLRTAAGKLRDEKKTASDSNSDRLVRFLAVGLGRLVAVQEDGGDDQRGAENKLETQDESEEEN
jgi:hypothetical protein